MTRDEAKHLVMMVSAAYPNWKPMDLRGTVDTWAVMLQEYEYQFCVVALKTYILTDTAGFAPSIGQLVEKLQQATKREDIGELDAWSMVSKALRNSTYHAEEEFAALPPVLQRTVGNPSNLKEWAGMEMDTVNSVIQSHVVRNYRAAVKSMRDDAKIPPALMGLLQDMRKEPEWVKIQKPQEQPALGSESMIEKKTPPSERTQRLIDELLHRT